MELIKKYVYEIYSQQSFTKAAKKLFISQPALSSAVSKYEKKLGYRIFDRSKGPIKLTPEGKILIESFEEIADIEESASQRIGQILHHRQTEINVGGISSAAYYSLPVICREFRKSFPSVNVRIDMNNLRTISLQDKLRNDAFDVIIDHVKGADDLESIPLFNDELIVAVKKSAVTNKKLMSYALPYERLDLISTFKGVGDTSLFKEINFLSFVKNSAVMGKKMTSIFGEYAPSQVFVDYAPNTILHHFLAREGCGALLTNVKAAKAFFTDTDEMCFIPLDNENAKRTIYIITKSGGERSEIVKRFIETAIELFGNGTQKHGNVKNTEETEK